MGERAVAEGKKSARRRGALIVFQDESGSDRSRSLAKTLLRSATSRAGRTASSVIRRPELLSQWTTSGADPWIGFFAGRA